MLEQETLIKLRGSYMEVGWDLLGGRAPMGGGDEGLE